MANKDYRVERDSMGELRVPEQALWGAQTQRAVDNFPVSGLPMPRGFIRALGLIKWAAAGANAELGLAQDRQGRGDTVSGAGDRGGAARQPVSNRCVPDRFRHQLQHECQRSDRTAGCPSAWCGRASQRRRQHGTEQQRCYSDGGPRERCPGGNRSVAARPGAPAQESLTTRQRKREMWSRPAART